MARDVQEEDIYTKTPKVESARNYQRLSSYYKSSTTTLCLSFVCQNQCFNVNVTNRNQKMIITDEIAKMLFLCNTEVMETHERLKMYLHSTVKFSSYEYRISYGERLFPTLASKTV